MVHVLVNLLWLSVFLQDSGSWLASWWWNHPSQASVLACIFFQKQSNILFRKSEINIYSLSNTVIKNNSVGTQANKNDGKRQIQWLPTITCWDEALNPKPDFQIFLSNKKQVFLWMWLRSRDHTATHSSKKFKRKQTSNLPTKTDSKRNSNLNKSDW